MIYEARHQACGTVVSDELPEGYPVEEGVGLYCPRCRQAFWHVAADEPAPALGSPEPALEAANPPALPHSGSEPVLDRSRGPRIWPAVTLIVLTAVAVLVLVLVLSRDTETEHLRRVAPAPTQATVTPAPTPTPTPTPTSTSARTVTQGAVTAALPPGWRALHDRGRLVLRGPGRGLVTVSGPLPSRGRHRGSVTSNGRQVTTLIAGRRSWLVVRYLGRPGGGVARSVRVR